MCNDASLLKCGMIDDCLKKTCQLYDSMKNEGFEVVCMNEE
jgi:hypothetical protein